jgi:two-component system sensor histidine kinase YesM
VRRDSITYKYLKAFLLSIVLPIFLISLVINNVYLQILLKNSSDRIQQSMEQIAIGIDNEVKNMLLSQATVTEANGNEIPGLVTQWGRAATQQDKYELSAQIDVKLNFLFNYRSDVAAVVFFLKNQGYYYFRNHLTVEESEIRSREWYRETVKNSGKPAVLGNEGDFVYNQNKKYLLALAVSPQTPVTRNDVELVYFAYRTNIFDSIYSEYKADQLGRMIILDGHKNVMFSRDNELMGKNYSELDYLKEAYEHVNSSYVETIDSRKIFITTHKMDRTNWYIVNMVDYNELTRDITKTMLVVIAVTSVIIMLFIAFSVLFFRGILNPVNTLVQGMKKVEKGDFETIIDIKGDGEIQRLGRSFNRMVNEIKNLIRERDIKERERSKAEIEALQSQINPHFISNTLNSIRLMAMIAKADNIKNITDAFMKLLTASFGKGGQTASVQAEVENLENYIYIMRVRYGDKFDIEFDIAEEIKECVILKLVLQPILENSIIHGVGELEKRGSIRITGRREQEALLFEIEDNGIGMTEDQIRKLLEEDIRDSKSFSSIGVRNVDRRIKLNHGDKYGISIESGYGRYTKVRILLPCIGKAGEVGQ